MSIIFHDRLKHIEEEAQLKQKEERRAKIMEERNSRTRRGLSNAPKSKGWKWIRSHRRNIILYGQKQGIIVRGPSKSQQKEEEKKQEGLSDEQYQRSKKNEKDLKGLSVKDKNRIHSAIPFLPVPAAAACCVLNLLLPGSGTILSGCLLFCMGRPRILYKVSRKSSSFVVNCIVGLSQLLTVTFLLVGWFWSIAWGYLMIAHSIQYREAVLANREEYVAEVALDAFSKGEILRRRNLRDFLKQSRTKEKANDTTNV